MSRLRLDASLAWVESFSVPSSPPWVECHSKTCLMRVARTSFCSPSTPAGKESARVSECSACLGSPWRQRDSLRGSHGEASWARRQQTSGGNGRRAESQETERLPTRFNKMSLTEVGLALESDFLTPRSEPTTPVVDFGLRHSGLERGERCRKTFSPFRSRLSRLKSLSLKAGRAQLGQAEGAKQQLMSIFKKPAWNHGDAWSPGL